MGPLTTYCQNHGIEVPFLPTAIKVVEKDALFATSAPKRSPYDIRAFVQEALTNPTSNFVLIGDGGHGVVSRAFHYYVANDHLAVFVQLKEGTDPSVIETTLDCVKDLFDQLKDKHLPPGKRMIVELSDFDGEDGERWTWVDAQKKGSMA